MFLIYLGSIFLVLQIKLIFFSSQIQKIFFLFLSPKFEKLKKCKFLFELEIKEDLSNLRD